MASTPDPTAIRLAATVVVMRGGGADASAAASTPGGLPEIFMVRRSARSPFMPDTFVFPGGRLDPDDGDPEHATEGHLAFERAARRETLEEASIDLEARELRWFDTWLTPSAEGKRRYLARFFIARLEAEEGHDAKHDGHETTDGFWSTAQGILDRWREGGVDLPPPTLSVLLGLAAADWPRVLERDPADLATPILPKVTAAGSELHIVMPHDPDYGGLPGDARPAPTRASDFPQRFIRLDNRWQPK